MVAPSWELPVKQRPLKLNDRLIMDTCELHSWRCGCRCRNGSSSMVFALSSCLSTLVRSHAPVIHSVVLTAAAAAGAPAQYRCPSESLTRPGCSVHVHVHGSLRPAAHLWGVACCDAVVVTQPSPQLLSLLHLLEGTGGKCLPCSPSLLKNKGSRSSRNLAQQ